MLNKIKRVARNNTPRWVVLTLDLLLSAFSFGLAYFVTEALNFDNLNAASYLYPLSLVLIFRLIAFIATKSYTGIIRYTSTQDAVRIFFAVAISTIAILFAEGTAYAYLGTHFIKPAVIIIDAFILIFFLSAFRISFKLLYNQYAPFNLRNTSK
ncbi:MAG: FlaA1/EpsC-like NDP-sugar epimerase, partial [Bacteroidia bacterium]